ncbi:MAG: LysM peptidoglycan-binding domain-containing protein, partial [Oscillospiraceae bacterium]|nr:LysM peptidoglycan-binding domain-containing protein [Oscillospiraceae bacterium]
ETDYKAASRAIKAAGYATAPDYADVLIKTIQTYGLNFYDPGGKFWPESSPEQSLEVKTCTVQAGDSFWKIAAEQLGDGGKYKELAEFNGLTPESIIFPGQVLKIPGK